MNILLTPDSVSDSVVRVSYPRERLSESTVLSSSTLDNILESKGSVIRIVASTPARKMVQH